jgi:CubicO group peptidase (beta-lactamase class C family)
MTVKKLASFFLALLLYASTFAQSKYKPTYLQLKEYEGTYEFVNSSTLQIAASPKDTILFAVIHKSNYPLLPDSNDVFLNVSKEKVRFYRDRQNAIAGYISNNDSFKLINRTVFFPKEMWYPRLNSAYQYHQPGKLNDGLQVGSVVQSDLDTALLNMMMHKIIAGDYPNVHSILIIKNNKLVFEEYFYEYTKDSLQELRSATKSFVSALAGIAIGNGYIKSKNEAVLSYFPQYQIKNPSPLKQKITIENMLANQSGLDCDVSNEKSEGNETKMDYSDDWVNFTLDLPMVDTPGGKGMYCSGNPVTIGRIIEIATKQPLAQFADETLFKPLRITSYQWNFRPDKSNAEDYCQVYLTPREMAKFGLLYLNNGNWNGKQVVPASWVKTSFEKHSVVQGVDYGYLWWLKYLDGNGVRYYGKAAQGNGGQRIFVFPDQKMVVVTTGGNYNTQSPSDELIRKYILPSLNNAKP